MSSRCQSLSIRRYFRPRFAMLGRPDRYILMGSRRPSHADSTRLALFPLAVTVMLLGLILAVAAGTSFGQSAPSLRSNVSVLQEEMEVGGVAEDKERLCLLGVIRNPIQQQL